MEIFQFHNMILSFRFIESLLPNLPKDKHNVIIMYNASYHGGIIEETRIPTTQFNKDRIKQWLSKYGTVS